MEIVKVWFKDTVISQSYLMCEIILVSRLSGSEGRFGVARRVIRALFNSLDKVLNVILLHSQRLSKKGSGGCSFRKHEVGKCLDLFIAALSCGNPRLHHLFIVILWVKRVKPEILKMLYAFIQQLKLRSCLSLLMITRDLESNSGNDNKYILAKGEENSLNLKGQHFS